MKFDLKIKSLKLRGFRGFKEPVELTFDSRLTVLIGENASGKSAILDAIAQHLMYLRHELTNRQLYHFPVPLHPKKRKNYDVNNACDELENSLQLRFTADLSEGDVNLLLRGSRNTMTDMEKLEIPNDVSEQEQADLRQKQQTLLNDFTYGIHNARRQQTLKRLPVMIYYGCNSIRTDVLEDIEELLHFDMMDTYRDALESKIFNFNQLVLLLDRRQKISLQQPNQQDIFLTALKKVIQEMLSEVPKIRYDNLRVAWGIFYDELVIDKVSESGACELIYLNQMSSGEQFILGLVADLTRRLYLANPSESPLEGSGVVLIDEIDLHLHPKWQRLIVPKLMKLFPNLQFVLTSHSPGVIAHCEPHQVLILKSEGHRGRIVRPKYTSGHSLEYILLNLMETPTQSNLVEDYLSLMRQDLLSSRQGKQLQKKMEQLDPNSPERLRLNFGLQRFKAIGK
jgi:predicted ATP-binding protein involved in virulence